MSTIYYVKVSDTQQSGGGGVGQCGFSVPGRTEVVVALLALFPPTALSPRSSMLSQGVGS